MTATHYTIISKDHSDKKIRKYTLFSYKSLRDLQPMIMKDPKISHCLITSSGVKVRITRNSIENISMRNKFSQMIRLIRKNLK